MQFPALFVTAHAIKRWRERGSTYGDEDGTHVIAAVRASEYVPDDAPCPLTRYEDCRYYRHAASGCWFAVQALPRGDGRVITVIPPDREVSKVVHPLPLEPREFESRDAERKALAALSKELNRIKGKHDFRALPIDVQRAIIIEQYEVGERLKELKRQIKSEKYLARHPLEEKT